MRTKLEKMEMKLEELRSSISPETWIQWKASGPTKCLTLQLEIDSEDLRENWASGKFSDMEQVKAQGQAEYVSGLPYVIDALGGSNED